MADISTPTALYDAMQPRWVLPTALMEGQAKIKADRERWLPKEPRETSTAYDNRLSRSSLFNVYRRTVRTLAGEPFTRRIIVDNETPDIEYIQRDTDTTGRNLSNFARDCLEDLLVYGLSHIIVDYPVNPGNLNLAQEREYGIRPYWTRVSPSNLIGWKIERVGGVDVITELRIKEEKYVDGDKPYEEVLATFIHRYTPEQIEKYVFDENKKEWVIVESNPNTLGYVPIVTAYANKLQSFVSNPPLEDLANLNIRHYQKLSDLDNIEHVANVPILFGSGFQEGELNGAEIGPNRILTASDPQSKLSYVEHTGAAIAASQVSLKEIEARMLQMGASILVQRNQNRETAFARSTDKQEALSDLQVMVRNLEDALERAYAFSGDWMGKEVQVEVSIGETLAIPNEPNPIDSLLKLKESGDLTSEDLVDELKRRGILAPTFMTNPTTINEDEVSESIN